MPIQTIITFIGIVILMTLLLAFPVMWMWNWTVPSIFENGPTITFWQAIKLMFLCQVLTANPSVSSSK